MCVLPKQEIKKLIIEKNMIEEKDDNCCRPASYDLRVGNVLSYKGKKYDIQSEGKLVFEPHEVAYIESKEIFNIPPNIVARYDLRMDFQRQGLLLQAGLHLDPGFFGRVYSLLFNLSNDKIEIKYLQTFASMEFSHLVNDTEELYKNRRCNKVM